MVVMTMIMKTVNNASINKETFVHRYQTAADDQDKLDIT
jgi:hypothetical protein